MKPRKQTVSTPGPKVVVTEVEGTLVAYVDYPNRPPIRIPLGEVAQPVVRTR
jgi:hypothetical protein